MARRRQLNVITNAAADAEDGCGEGGCNGGHAGPPGAHETSILSLNVLANGCGS